MVGLHCERSGQSYFGWTDILFRHWSLTEGQQILAKCLVLTLAGHGSLMNDMDPREPRETYKEGMLESIRDHDLSAFVRYAIPAARIACVLDVNIPGGSSRENVLDVVFGRTEWSSDDEDESSSKSSKDDGEDV